MATGHREQLRKKFLQLPMEFDEVAFLELLLTYSIPRIDVRPLAQRLIDLTGSLDTLMDSPPDQLQHKFRLGTSTAVLLNLVARLGSRQHHDPSPLTSVPAMSAPTRSRSTSCYDSQLTVGALLLAETRSLADLYLNGVTGSDLRKQVLANNLLQKRSRGSSTRIITLITSRLESIDKAVIPLILSDDYHLARQAAFAATVKQSRILGDFMHKILADQYRTFTKYLYRGSVSAYLDDLALQHPDIAAWSDKTRAKLAARILKCLVEGEYLSDMKLFMLQRMQMRPELRQGLEDANEQYVLQCMDICR